MGDYRMLKAGGVLDQPLKWFAVQRARKIDQILSDMEDSEFSAVKKFNSGSWSESDMAMYEAIMELREELKNG